MTRRVHLDANEDKEILFFTNGIVLFDSVEMDVGETQKVPSHYGEMIDVDQRKRK